jgi:hypothetical protein
VEHTIPDRKSTKKILGWVGLIHRIYPFKGNTGQERAAYHKQWLPFTAVFLRKGLLMAGVDIPWHPLAIFSGKRLDGKAYIWI